MIMFTYIDIHFTISEYNHITIIFRICEMWMKKDKDIVEITVFLFKLLYQ